MTSQSRRSVVATETEWEKAWREHMDALASAARKKAMS